MEVWLLEARTGLVIDHKKWFGDSPDICPYIKDTLKPVENLYGDRVSWDKISSWLEKYVITD